MSAEILRDTMPGNTANPSTDLLDCRHQREAEHHGPGQTISELRTDLTVGCDTAGIVVRRPCHQTRSKAPQKAEWASL